MKLVFDILKLVIQLCTCCIKIKQGEDQAEQQRIQGERQAKQQRIQGERQRLLVNEVVKVRVAKM